LQKQRRLERFKMMVWHRGSLGFGFEAFSLQLIVFIEHSILEYLLQGGGWRYSWRYG
jgi:hypothetical protein